MDLESTVEELYYLCSENNGADQLHSYCEAALHLCWRICFRMMLLVCKLMVKSTYNVTYNISQHDINYNECWTQDLKVVGFKPH